jgi:hypothetical protein
MTFQEEIAALKARIAASHAERDGWRTSGMQKKYLEAYSRVETLELQLEGLRREGLQISARSEHAVQRDLDDGPRWLRQSVAGGEAALSVPAAQGAHAPDALQRELMAEFAITFRADAYHLGPHRYTMLDDAVNYARLLRMQGREVDCLE